MSWEGYRWIIPCATKPPDLTVMIAGAKALIPGYSLMTYILAHRGGVCKLPILCCPECPESVRLPSNKMADTDFWLVGCQGGVQATEGHNHGNLANYFFMSQFVAFNVAEKTISFAPYAS